MQALILAAALAAGTAVPEAMIATRGSDEVRLVTQPCPYAAVLMHLTPEQRPEYQKAEARLGGKRYFACWRLQGNVVHLVYEDGDQGVVPVVELRPEEGTPPWAPDT